MKLRTCFNVMCGGQGWDIRINIAGKGANALYAACPMIASSQDARLVKAALPEAPHAQAR